jgi:hypothetical protein
MQKTFGIITTSHKRSNVLHLFLAGIKRLRTEMEMYIPCVVVGDAEHKELCEGFFVDHITMDNHPVTRKWNAGVDYMMNLGMDYILVSGSDDLYSTDLVKKLYEQMQNNIDLIGIDKVYFYDGNGANRGKLVLHEAPRQLLGVGRCISSRVIKEAGVLWNVDKSWGMDGICLRNILRHVKSKAIVDGMCVDVKTTKANLNQFSLWFNKAKGLTPVEEFYSWISEEEKQILKTL